MPLREKKDSLHGRPALVLGFARLDSTLSILLQNLLPFDVMGNDCDGSASTAPGYFFSEKDFLKRLSVCPEGLSPLGIIYQEMGVLAINVHQIQLAVGSDVGEDETQVDKNHFNECLSTIFCH